MSEAEPSAGQPWLVVSDVDETLTGDVNALKDLALAINRDRKRLRFFLNSSRPLASVLKTLTGDFPRGFAPDGVISALGTEILVGQVRLTDWEARFATWPHRQIFDLLTSLGHRPHDPELQTSSKVSFAVPRGAAQREVREALIDAGIACQIIVSGVDDLDVIPPQAGKGAATLHLAKVLDVDPNRLIVAGDSGNDVALFEVARRGIAVANAHGELLEQLDKRDFYLAKKPHAAGVLEGLVHYSVLSAGSA